MTDLRRRFGRPSSRSRAVQPCPSAESIAGAARGEIAGDDLVPLVEHAAICPACAVAWRVIREGTASESGRAAPSAAPASPRRVWIAAACFVLAVAAAVLIWLPRGDREPASYRVSTRSPIESLTDERIPLARDAAVLRWKGGPEGTRYRVRVTDADLATIVESPAQEATEFLVPAETLSRIESGETIYWQVEAIRPDGYRVLSETFPARIE